MEQELCFPLNKKNCPGPYEGEELLTHLRSGITQHTDEWFDARFKLVTASDVPTLLGVSKYNNNKDELLRQKQKKERVEPNFAMQWGTNNEGKAKRALCMILGREDLFECGLIVHPEVSFLGASPDGFFGDGTIVEIKCPLRRKIETDKINEYKDYYIQVQTQLLVTGASKCILFLYRRPCKFNSFKTEYAMYEISRNPTTMNYILAEAQNFYNKMFPEEKY